MSAKRSVQSCRHAFLRHMDPFLGAAGSGVVANIVTSAIQSVGKLVTTTGWERADELTRLFYLLEAAFSDELPAITQTELEGWRENAPFMKVYDQLSAGAEPEEQHNALVATCRGVSVAVGPTRGSIASAERTLTRKRQPVRPQSERDPAACQL